MGSNPKRTGNQILDLLQSEDANRLLSSSQFVTLPPGHVVCRQDGPMPYVYFPITGVFGIVLALEEGKQVEANVVGREGMVGLPVFLGLDFHPSTAVAQVPGQALRVPARALVQAAREGGRLDGLLRRYTLYRLRSADQTGACNALHSVEERICRWLLMAHDRAGRDEFTLTHESLAELLGVRRQTVSLTASRLQRQGLIAYHRGILRVLRRSGLEAASCECYQVLKHLYRRIML